jgi:hypothetical protein
MYITLSAIQFSAWSDAARISILKGIHKIFVCTHHIQNHLEGTSFVIQPNGQISGDIAGAVASMTEGDPGVASERVKEPPTRPLVNRTVPQARDGGQGVWMFSTM